MGQNAATFGRHHHAHRHELVRRHPVDLPAFIDDATVFRFEQSGDRAQRRSFARAVRADQSDDLALPDVQ
jgi:hypothetical protein